MLIKEFLGRYVGHLKDIQRNVDFNSNRNGWQKDMVTNSECCSTSCLINLKMASKMYAVKGFQCGYAVQKLKMTDQDHHMIFLILGTD